MKSRKWAGIAALVLIVAGLGISYYLFARGIKLAQGQAGSDFCSAVFETSCDGTLTSEYSHAFGLSLGGWGVVYFGILGALVLGGMWLRDVFLRPALSAAMLVNLTGLVISGYLATLFLTGKVPLCPLCIATHAVNLALFVMLLLYRGESPLGFLTDARNAAVYIFAPAQAATPENTTRMVAFIATGLVALALYFALALQSIPPAPLTALPPSGATPSGGAYDELVRNVLKRYDDQAVTEVPIGPNDPRLGPADAPIQIVVFSDFECPSSKLQSHVLEELVKTYGNRISIVTKNYPLNKDCNPAIASKPHQNACLAAYASVAANIQGKYWPFHDIVYRQKGSPSADVLSQIAQAAHLDMTRFSTDMASDAVKAKVTEDVQLAIKLQARQTPWTYLNGKLLTGELVGQLPALVKYVAQSKAPQPPSGSAPPSITYDELVRNILSLYDDQEMTEVPIGPNDPRLGPADAPIQIVVFSDFECPSCKTQSHVLEELVKTYGNRISIVAKNYPLNADCNPAVASKQHRNACLAAYASVAANIQGQYWPFHDLVYRQKASPSPDMLSQIAQAVHLDVPRFLIDMASDAAKTKVADDVQLGMTLKVTQTPWTYLNGKLLTNELVDQLPTLVKYVAQAQAQKPAARK